ncbi:hypothetical protein ISS42_00060 [Candidatus Shapirobacteria bacterium]|nr:hypothetical protein [Candidatus Shapirobacteria bacterium]
MTDWEPGLPPVEISKLTTDVAWLDDLDGQKFYFPRFLDHWRRQGLGIPEAELDPDQKERLDLCLRTTSLPTLLAVHLALNRSGKIPNTKAGQEPKIALSIAGHSGSGKSIISAALSLATGAPILDLDPFSQLSSTYYLEELRKAGLDSKQSMADIVLALLKIRAKYQKGELTIPERRPAAITVKETLNKGLALAQSPSPFIICDCPGYPIEAFLRKPDTREADEWDVAANQTTEAILRLLPADLKRRVPELLWGEDLHRRGKSLPRPSLVWHNPYIDDDTDPFLAVHLQILAMSNLIGSLKQKMPTIIERGKEVRERFIQKVLS